VVDTANNYDIAYLGGTFDDTYDFIHNSYAYGVTSTYGTLNTTDYTTVDGMPMLNWTAWDNSEETIAQYGTPMPKLVDGWEALGYRYYKDAYKNSNWYDNLPYGHSASVNGAGYEQGVFSEYDELVGAGTEADPYIIDNAQLLFEIIASGGTHRGVPQYFKLGCDVDLGGIQWVNYQTNADRNDTYGISYYAYKPFAGTIDGDGHTVTGMFTATADTNAGFIPELTATGVVKNLHFRDCYAYTSSGNYGIIAGTAASGSQIIGCSIENSENAKIVGSNAATITNSYITVDGSTTYYLDSGSTGTPTVDGVTWYQGGADGSAPKLVNRADAMPYADADGDGDGYEYGTRDLAALKSKLLRAPDYANIYGDVSRNGKTDIRDMVILQREIIAMSASDPTAEWKILDGFWKNVKAGKFSIYYDENDNYDFARKMELYIEETTGVDILKTKGTTTANLTIRIVTDDTLGANNYSVSYDLETATLTISGGSFTAVEQGVLNFIANSNALNGTVYTGSGSLAPEKQAINVQTYSTSNENGYLTNSSSIVDKGTYYYVWGDEFNTAVNGTVLYDTWIVRDKGHGNGSNDFTNLYLANADDLPKLNVVSGGKLTMHRGVGSLAPTSGTLSGSTDDNGAYIAFDGNSMSSSGLLTSINSMLFKRGYIEMQAILPNDDYAFPAWWLVTYAGNNNLEVSSSLYSKVYERNSGFDGNSLYYSSDDYTTYEYKLPTSYFEIDLFEIINNPNGSGKRDTIFYNIHKWYSYSKTYEGSTKGFSVYELDWDALEDGTISDFDDEGNKLLDATYDSGTYSISNAAIKYHASNAESGQINVAINEFGTNTASGTTYGKFDDTDITLEDILAGVWEKEPFDVNMVTSIGDSTTVTEYRYGFLWTEDEMTFIIKDTSDNLLSSVTVNCADLGYDGGSVMAEQYAYFLIDNHYYTKDGAKISSDMPMTIEYVRLYQLDGARDIVTPETEAFNSNTRW
ncbi:MAG: hypothetical protein IJY79_09010, partial [Clostridia bacterium]|nr:hypothetical protein [Clostridia bacterium]